MDRAKMKSLFILCICIMSFWGNIVDSYGQAFKFNLFSQINYSEEKVHPYTLPDVLLCEDGTKVTTVKQWERKRRPEILELFSNYMFGKVPFPPSKPKWRIKCTDYSALGGKAIRRDVEIWLLRNAHNSKVSLQIYLPHEAMQHPVPLFFAIALLPNYTVCNDLSVEMPDTILIADGKKRVAYKRGYMSDFWQLEKILEHGYGLATYCYQDVAVDNLKGFLTGIPSLFYRKGQDYPSPNEWGAISLWAWSMRQVMDYIVTDKMVDKNKVIAIGHSRLGKTALWAAAQDSRFAMVIPNNTGCGGTAIARRNFGETVDAINQQYPHWFCSNYKQFDNREDFMPFDQHELVALIAPRPIYIASAEDDRWADPQGEFLGGKGASSVYNLYGLRGLECDSMPPLNSPVVDGFIGYHIRTGKHTMTAFDWEQFLNFADKFFK